MFIYVENTDGNYQSYDETFKNYATIEFKSGSTTYTISRCDPDTYSKFIIPLSKYVGMPNTYCPSIDVFNAI